MKKEFERRIAYLIIWKGRWFDALTVNLSPVPPTTHPFFCLSFNAKYKSNKDLLLRIDNTPRKKMIFLHISGNLSPYFFFKI